MNEILETISDYLRRTAPEAVGNNAGIADLPVHKTLDSIGMIDFITFLETTFQVRITDADVLPENFGTFAAVARLIEKKKVPRSRL